jgi:formylglycine-generating enzyme required for sulfatase activity
MGTVAWLRFLAALFGLAVGLGVGAAGADERIALVIGNSNYKNAEPLENPKNDAEAVGEALRRVGFKVDVAIDLDQLGLLEAFRSFGLKAESADVAVVFYAGHGIQVANENYLLPVDATLARERDVLYQALPLSLVMEEVAQAKRLGLMILDACRDNPLAERLREALGPIRSRLVGVGLARVENIPSDTMVAFSTKPGELAVDGEGQHSPYTAALLKHIEEPGVELNLLFRKVRDSVLEATAYRQEPRNYDALGAEPFYFKELKPNQRPELAVPVPLELLDDAGPTPLAVGAPTDPDDDALTAQVVGLPQRGRVQLGDRTLLIGDVLTVEQLTAVTYAPQPGAIGDAGSFEFVVKDNRGGAVVGRLPITIERSNRPPVVETAQVFRLPAIPLSIDKPGDPEGDPLTVTVLEVPERGAIKSGDRVIQRGDEITPDELASLVLEPGPQGASGAFGFRVTDPYGASATSSMRFNIPGPGVAPTATADVAPTEPAAPSEVASPPAETSPPAEASRAAKTPPPAAMTTALAAPASPKEPEAAMPAETRAIPRQMAVLPRAEPTSPEDQAIVGEYETVRDSNIRRGAGTDTERVAKVSEGATLHVIGTVEGRNWFRVRTEDGTEGFIYGTLIRPKPSPAPAEPELESAPKVEQAALPVGRVLASVIKDCPTCPELVSIPPGTFRMGSDEGHWSERPVHRVAVGAPFALGKYEVTVGEWQACVDAGACSSRPDMNEVRDSTPIHNVSWQDAQDYIAWLRQTTGQPYRLPTEAEWEYAARAESTTRFWWGDSVGVGKADCQDCGGDWDRSKPSDIGAFPPNPFGLYDMNGGAMEWVADCWIQDYRTAPGDASARIESNCMQRTLRGGSWRNDQSYATATSRLGYDAGVRYYTNGFRVARDLN